MKIGIVLHPYSEKNPAGLGRFILELSRSLVSSSVDDEYILYVKGNPRAPDFVDGKRITMVSLGSSFFWLEGLKHAPKADVYLFNTPVMPLFWQPRRSIVIALDFAYLLFRAKNLKEFFSRIVVRAYHARALKRVSKIISISQATKDDTVKFFGIDPAKIDVIYPGFNSIAKLEPHTLTVPEKFFLFVGVIKERKNVLGVVKAYEQFHAKNKGVPLLIAGKKSGAYFEEVEAYVKTHGLAEDVRFIGFVTDNELSFLYQKATALLFPSIVEGFGFPILEAMDAGLPVITSKSSSLGEIAQDAALTVSPHDIGEIASAMEKLVNNNETRDALIKKGIERIKKFSWIEAAQETLSVAHGLTRGPRVAILTHNVRPDNGAGVFSARLIKAMEERGATITALTTVPLHKAGVEKDEQAILYPSKLKLARAFFRIRAVLREADFVHALDLYPYGLIAYFAGFGLRKKLFITAIGSGSLIPFKNGITGMVSRMVLHRAAKVTAISSFTKREVQKHAPYLEMEVLSHGVDFSFFQKSRVTGRATVYMPYILSIGTLRWRKGYKRSIPAFAEVAKVFPDLQYVIIGKKANEENFEAMKKLIAEYKLETKIHILDSVESREELAAYLQHAELFCLCSQNVGQDLEGFGLVFLEAAAAGKAVVGTRGSGIEDAVQENSNGYLVDAYDVRGFAASIVKILGDRELKTSMERASVTFAKNEDWEEKFDRYFAIYESLLEKRG